MRKPDFMIIGVQKAGTTALKIYLLQHPDIWMSKDEIHYFDTQPFRGDRWYLNHFQRMDKFVGEKTPGYIYHEHAVKHLAKLCPDTKLIVLLRNPVSRAYSEYKMLRLNGYYHESFEQVVFKDGEIFERPAVIRRGLYVEQLKRLYKYFNKNQILVLKAEDLHNNKQEVVNQVTDFIGASRFTLIDDADKHVGGEVRFEWLNYITGFFEHIRNQNKRKFLFVSYFCTKIIRWTKGINKIKGYRPMNEDTKKKLQEYFAEKNKELYDMVGIKW